MINTCPPLVAAAVPSPDGAGGNGGGRAEDAGGGEDACAAVAFTAMLAQHELKRWMYRVEVVAVASSSTRDIARGEGESGEEKEIQARKETALLDGKPQPESHLMCTALLVLLLDRLFDFYVCMRQDIWHCRRRHI
jgi:hypothetical protein